MLLLSFYSTVNAGVIIDTPIECPKIEKTEGDRVYLVADEKCDSGIKKIEIDMEIKDGIDVYVSGKFWKRHTPSSFDSDIVGNIAKYNDKVITENKYSDIGEKEAKKAFDIYKSDNFQREIAKQTERLKQDKTIFNGYADLQENNKNNKQTSGLLKNKRLYIFISSSIPIDTLRAYSSMVGFLGDPNIIFVMRGFVDGMTNIKPTMNFSLNVLKKDKDCTFSLNNKCDLYPINFQIDPTLFTRYNIDKVPAFVYIPKIEIVKPEYSEGDTENAKESENFILYGDAKLDYIIETFYNKTGDKNLKTLLESRLGGFYNKTKEGRKE